MEGAIVRPLFGLWLVHCSRLFCIICRPPPTSYSWAVPNARFTSQASVLLPNSPLSHLYVSARKEASDAHILSRCLILSPSWQSPHSSPLGKRLLHITNTCGSVTCARNRRLVLRRPFGKVAFIQFVRIQRVMPPVPREHPTWLAPSVEGKELCIGRSSVMQLRPAERRRKPRPTQQWCLEKARWRARFLWFCGESIGEARVRSLRLSR